MFMATSNFPFSRHKYQDGRCRIPFPSDIRAGHAAQATLPAISIPHPPFAAALAISRRCGHLECHLGSCARAATGRTVARSAPAFIHLFTATPDRILLVSIHFPYRACLCDRLPRHKSQLSDSGSVSDLASRTCASVSAPAHKQMQIGRNV